LLGDFKPIRARQHKIQNHDIRPLVSQERARAVSIREHADDLMPGFPADIPQDVAYEPMIVDNRDPHGFSKAYTMPEGKDCSYFAC
jgi:hypothetical protein